MMTDPIADMLTRLRNAKVARLDRTEMPLSKLKMRVAGILKQEGYINDYEVNEAHPPMLTVVLKYNDRRAAFNKITRTSRPGRRAHCLAGGRAAGALGGAAVTLHPSGTQRPPPGLRTRR